MGLMWLIDSIMLLSFAVMIMFMVIGVAFILLLPLLYLLPESDIDPAIYLESFDDLPRNIKSKTTTKMRWAQRSQRTSDDSFANGIMWADLGND